MPERKYSRKVIKARIEKAREEVRVKAIARHKAKRARLAKASIRVSPQLKIACLYLAIGYSHKKTAEILGVTTATINKIEKIPKFRKIIDKHQATLAKLLINAAIVAAYSDLTHTGRVMVPIPPKKLTKKQVDKARIKKNAHRKKPLDK